MSATRPLQRQSGAIVLERLQRRPYLPSSFSIHPLTCALRRKTIILFSYDKKRIIEKERNKLLGLIGKIWKGAIHPGRFQHQ